MANKHKGKGGKSGYRKVMKSAETHTELGKYKEHIDKLWQEICAHKCNHCDKEAVFDVINPTRDSGVQRLKLCKDCCQSHKDSKKVVIDCDPDAGVLKVTKK